MVDDIAHIIPTHERPGVCQRLVNSINKFYPDSNIYVCDDSDRPAEYEGAVNIKSPAYDIGLSAKRNLLVQKTEEPYIFLWDDDYMMSEDTNLELLYHGLKNLDGYGLLGAEWMLSNGSRDVWFTGDFWVEGPIEKHRPPNDNPKTVETDAGPLRYHDVMFTPNWFIARRDTIESIYWDERLKLQEHSEFFARMAAARAKRGDGYKERDSIWLERYEDRSSGHSDQPKNENGRVEVYSLATFRNATKLDHVGGVVSRGDWVYLDPEYARQLEEKGLVYTRKEMNLARPFYVPSVEKDVPLKVAFTPENTCFHLRNQEGTKNNEYNENRTRQTFWTIQKEKLGTEELDLKQWSNYPSADFGFTKPNSVDTSKPNNYKYYDED